MENPSIFFTIFLIFTGAAIVATVALFARQAMIVAYILLGLILGPSLLNWVGNPELLQKFSDIGIVFLLFLLGLNLHPQKLIALLREAMVVTFVSSFIFAVVGALIPFAFGFDLKESIIVGSTVMFSSTIIGLKLTPTTELHHRHTGEIIISILLLQDFIAILLLILLQASGSKHALTMDLGMLIVALIGITVFAYLMERFILIPLIRRFDKIQEYIFLLAIGWCLGMAELASYLGLSHEIGAFIAGVAIATNRISLFIADSLKPLRDFFLIIFFFVIGASTDLSQLANVLLPGLVLALAILLGKPWVFGWLLKYEGESRKQAMEIGCRLGQGSEFSFLIMVLSLQLGLINTQASALIQLATLVTFVFSTYFVVFRYPTPIAVSDKLRKT
jgi:Kef-type K+ transport system membrane component KefB